MLSVRPTSPEKCTPNLLPARINHNGPINSTHRYWKPETDSTGKQHAYFRGRHLHGTVLAVPENYTGAVLHVTDKQVPQVRSQAQADGEEEEDGEDSLPVEVMVAEQVGVFEEVVVWGHGGEVDGGQDLFVRGVREWVGFAESMHVDDDD
ncbi:ribonuclease H1 small subunit, partial [Decorospora gaudefroyi]